MSPRTPRPRLRWIALLASVPVIACGSLAACGGDDDAIAPEPIVVPDAGPGPIGPTADAAGHDATTADAAGGLSLSACPANFVGGCATVEMPLDWSAPSGKQIPIFIDKIASTTRPKRQVWVLQGGPGGTAAGVVPIGLQIAEGMDDVEVLTIEHRGVGFSSRLGCPVYEAAHPNGPIPQDAGSDGGDAGSAPDLGCYQEIQASFGDDLRFYTTTNAARDLERAIAIARRPGVPVYVYGVSYGTYWAHRFLQIAPTGADGVILDSVVTPGEQFLSNFDAQGDAVAKKVADLCKLDATCNANLGPDPWAFIVAAKAKLESGHCPEAGLGPRDRVRLTALLQIRSLSGYALALLHRFTRCSPDDVTAIKTFLGRDLFADPAVYLSSDGLYANVGFSELWETPAPDVATMNARFADAAFPVGQTDNMPLFASWPKYEKDEHVGQFAKTSVPLLILAGTLDMQTPFELQQKFAPHFTGPHQTFVTVPTANHAVITQSPMIPVGGVEKQCGFEVMLQFLANPEATLDSSCTTKLAGIPFTRDPQEVSYLFGTTDMWLGVRRETSTEPSSIAALRSIPRLRNRRAF